MALLWFYCRTHGTTQTMILEAASRPDGIALLGLKPTDLGNLTKLLACSLLGFSVGEPWGISLLAILKPPLLS